MTGLEKLQSRELGKFFEQLLSSNLIRLGFEVYTPVLDKGIDFIARKQSGDQPEYFEIQVKSVRRKGGRLTVSTETFSENRKNLFLVFFNVRNDRDYDAYIMSSKDVHEIFEKQEQNKKPIYRLYAKESDLRKIKSFRWNMDEVPTVWK